MFLFINAESIKQMVCSLHNFLTGGLFSYKGKPKYIEDSAGILVFILQTQNRNRYIPRIKYSGPRFNRFSFILSDDCSQWILSKFKEYKSTVKEHIHHIWKANGKEINEKI